MHNLILITVIILFLCVIVLIIIRIRNSFILNKLLVPEIKSADINISTSKINELSTKLINSLGCSDLLLQYSENDHYISPFNMLDNRNKKIVVPKWIMPSVGYELDYLFGSIWLACSIKNKTKDILRYRYVVILLPLIARIIFYFGFILSLVILVLYKIDFKEYTTFVKIINFLEKYPIIQSISFSGFLMIIFCSLFADAHKQNLEIAYQKVIIEFVNNNCQGYKSDIVAARMYSTNFNKISFPIAKINKKTGDLKYLGPFVSMQ